MPLNGEASQTGQLWKINASKVGQQMSVNRPRLAPPLSTRAVAVSRDSPAKIIE